MTGPQDPAAAGGDRLRAGHADREQVIDTLKHRVRARPGDQGRTRRAGRPDARRPDLRRPGRAHRRHPARPRRPSRGRAGAPARPGTPLAAGQGGRRVGRLPGLRGRCYVGRRHSPSGSPRPKSRSWLGSPMLLIALSAVLAALGFLIAGMSTSLKQRRSRGQLPPRPGPGGHALDGGRRGGTGHGPVPPGPRTGHARADLRAHQSRQHRRHIPPERAGHPWRQTGAGRGMTPVKPAPGPVPPRLSRPGFTS